MSSDKIVGVRGSEQRETPPRGVNTLPPRQPPYLVDFGTTFRREKLQEATSAILGFSTPRVVIWQLAKMETIPWMDLMFVVGIMGELKPRARYCIEKSIIVLPGPNWQYALDTLFTYAKPDAPYEIVSEEIPLQYREQQNRSVPRFMRS